MAATIAVDSVSNKGSMIRSRKNSVINCLAPDGFGSPDFGRANGGSVYTVYVGDESVNPGRGRLPRTDKVSGGQQDTNGNADNISVMVSEPSEEPVTSWPFTGQRTEFGETHFESISADQNEQDKTQTPPEKIKPTDVSESLSMRDYLMALSLFFITFLTYGSTGALPMLTVEWLQEFNHSKSLVLFVPSLAYALTSAVGVIDGFLINRFGIFNIIIIGCFMQVVCVIGSSFSTNAITLVIVLGFLLGVAACFSYLNCFILMGLQFGDAGKSFLAALSLAGPLSGAIYPNIIPVAIEQYTWRGCMLIIAGFNLQTIPLSLFLFLSQKHKKKRQLKNVARAKTEATDPINPAPKKALDFSVFKDPVYVAYLVAVTFTLSGGIGINGLFPTFMESKGLKPREAGKLYSIYRAGSALPRIFIGLILRWVKFRFMYIFIGLGLLFGLMSIIINLAESYSALLVYTMALSLCMGGPVGLYPIGTLECAGQEKYSFAASVIETSYGVGVGVFGYLAGLLVVYLDSYQETLFIYGALMIFSNISLLVTVLVQNWRNKKGFSEL